MEILNYEILNASGEADKNALPMFSSNTYPCFLDLAFSKNMSIHDIAVVFPDETEAIYTVFWSIDGVNFYKLGKSPKIARYIRIFIKYYSGTHPTINNVVVLGENCSFPSKKVQFNEPCPFDKTEYGKEITDEDIINDVYGIIGRVIGKAYKEQFELRLDYRLKGDYFTIESLRGKIRLISNSGVGLASAFNCYLKEICSCHISRFGKQVKLPQNLPQVKGKIHRETTVKYRYSYNYCTHSYSMAMWDYDKWQDEIDFLAMNGVNLVLDITGMEEVYRRFLTKIGYRHREIKNFITGPFYFAWFNMSNMTGFGGPLHDDFFKERCDLARANHRRMKVLGMDVVLQGFMGSVPCDIKKKDRDVPVINQGYWNGFERPAMVSPDSVAFVKYAKLFYEAQKEVFGDITHFYAGDICHEGGRLGKADIKESYQNIIESMLSFDKDAVWVVQSWGENPTKKFTKYTKPFRDDHILMLNLYAEKDDRNEKSFGQLSKFNNLFGMLNNFGGRIGLYGNIDGLSQKLPSAMKKENFKGLAITAESNNVNPIIYEYFMSFIWETPKDYKDWTHKYCERRYGSENEKLVKATDIFLSTVYSESSFGKTEGAPECSLCCRPDQSSSSVSAWGGTKIKYDEALFEKGVSLFLEDFDKLKTNECYIYDAVDLLRQVIANKLTHTIKHLQTSYEAKDYLVCFEYGEKLIKLAEQLNKVLLNSKYFSFSSYIEPIDKYTQKLDDFTRELYLINAKALITTWGPRPCSEKGKLHDYANRLYGDFVIDFYKTRWVEFLKNAKAEADGGKAENIDWFKLDWDWVLSEPHYTEKLRCDSLKALGKQIISE